MAEGILDVIKSWLGIEGEPMAGAPIAEKRDTDKQKIVEIIRELEHRESHAIPISDIVTEAGKAGISEEKARLLVNELVRDGFLTRPAWMEDIVRLHGVTDYSPWSEDFPA